MRFFFKLLCALLRIRCHRTGESRWLTTHEQGDYKRQVYQLEWINMRTGRRTWHWGGQPTRLLRRTR